jgi:secreted effector protein SseB
MSTISTTEQTAPTGTYVNSDAPTDIRYGCALKETSLVGNAMVTMADMMLMFSQLANDKFTQMSKKMDVARDVQDMANRLEIIMSKIEGKDGTGELPADIIEYMRENNILIGEQTIDEFLALGGDAKSFMNAFMAETAYLESGDKYGSRSASHFKKFRDIFDRLGIKIEGKSFSEYLDAHTDAYGNTHADYIMVMRQAVRESGDMTLNPNISKEKMEGIKTSLESAGGRASDFVQQSQLKLQQLMQNFNTAVTMANSIQSMNAESTKSIAQSIR